MKKWTYFLPALAFYLLIFLVSSSHIDIDADIDHLDKAGHLLEFGLMGFFLAIGFFNALSVSPSTKFVLTFGSGLILAVLDEFHQFFVPFRKSDIADILADAAGLVFGILVFRFLSVRRKRAGKEPG
jgi:VanZ family protein